MDNLGKKKKSWWGQRVSSTNQDFVFYLCCALALIGVLSMSTGSLAFQVTDLQEKLSLFEEPPVCVEVECVEWDYLCGKYVDGNVLVPAFCTETSSFLVDKNCLCMSDEVCAGVE